MREIKRGDVVILKAEHRLSNESVTYYFIIERVEEVIQTGCPTGQKKLFRMKYWSDGEETSDVMSINKSLDDYESLSMMGYHVMSSRDEQI